MTEPYDATWVDGIFRLPFAGAEDTRRRSFRNRGRAFKLGGKAAPGCPNTVQGWRQEKILWSRNTTSPLGPFRLDVTYGRLWRGNQVLALRPRSLAVLRHLVEHPGRLVTKAELQRRVWAGTLSWLVQVLWGLGYADQARQRSQGR
jgi:DNA-binding response OmpR family regulator